MPAWVHVASIVFCSHIYFRFLQSLCRKHFLRVSKTLVGGGSPALSMVKEYLQVYVAFKVVFASILRKFQAIFDMVDSNGNGYVDFVEYMTAVSANRSTAKTLKWHSLRFVWIKGDESWGQARLDLQCVWQGSGRIHWLLRDPSRSDQVEIILPHLTLFYQDIYCGQRTITKSTLIPMSKKIFNQNS